MHQCNINIRCPISPYQQRNISFSAYVLFIVPGNQAGLRQQWKFLVELVILLRPHVTCTMLHLCTRSFERPSLVLLYLKNTRFVERSIRDQNFLLVLIITQIFLHRVLFPTSFPITLHGHQLSERLRATRSALVLLTTL